MKRLNLKNKPNKYLLEKFFLRRLNVTEKITYFFKFYLNDLT